MTKKLLFLFKKGPEKNIFYETSVNVKTTQHAYILPTLLQAQLRVSSGTIFTKKVFGFFSTTEGACVKGGAKINRFWRQRL